MACLTSCRICGAGLIDCYMCHECNGEIAERASKGLPYDEEEVARVVKERRYLKSQRENQELLEHMLDGFERDNWRKHRDRAEALQDRINEAIEKAKLYSGVPEIDAIRRILESK